jgi:hypothetical protein
MEKRREEKNYGRVKKPHSSSNLPRVRFTNVVGVRVDVVNELAPDCAGDVAASELCDGDDSGSGDGDGSVELICALGSIGGSSIWRGKAGEGASRRPPPAMFASWCAVCGMCFRTRSWVIAGVVVWRAVVGVDDVSEYFLARSGVSSVE